MTRPNLEEMLARAEAATEGPWVWGDVKHSGAGRRHVDGMDHIARCGAPTFEHLGLYGEGEDLSGPLVLSVELPSGPVEDNERGGVPSTPDADLLTAARTDLPAAVRYAMELEKTVSIAHSIIEYETGAERCYCYICTAVRARQVSE